MIIQQILNMQTSLVLLLLGVTLCWAGKADIFCKKGKLFKKINVREGDSFFFSTHNLESRTYAPNTKCFATYARKASCPEMRFSCYEFNISNKRKNCKEKDAMQIQANGKKKSYCKRDGPDVTTTGKTLKVSFLSDRKKQSSGAVCTLECVTSVETTIRPLLTVIPGWNFLSPKVGVDICNQPPFPCDIGSDTTSTKELCAQSCSGQPGAVAWVWSDPNIEGVQDANKCTCKNSTIVHDEFVDTPWGVFGPTYPIIGLDIANQPPFGSDIPGGYMPSYGFCAYGCRQLNAVAWVWSDPLVPGVQEPRKCTCKTNITGQPWVQTAWAVAGFISPILLY